KLAAARLPQVQLGFFLPTRCIRQSEAPNKQDTTPGCSSPSRIHPQPPESSLERGRRTLRLARTARPAKLRAASRRTVSRDFQHLGVAACRDRSRILELALKLETGNRLSASYSYELRLAFSASVHSLRASPTER